MKFFRYCLAGILVALCLFGSCSMVETELEDFLTTEETTQEEDETTSEEEKEREEEEKNEEDVEIPEEIPEEIPPAPVFLYCKTVSENEIVFVFSQPVKMVDLCFSPELEHEIAGEGRTIKVNLAENLKSGQKVTADFLAEDAYENSIFKQVLFSSTVTPAPALQINELYTEYSKPKAEFIELKMLSDGNLGALRVFAAGKDKISMIYEFEPVQVFKDDYVVLHLRTPETSCVDEFGDNLNESGGTFSSSKARDFWIPSLTNKLLHRTDAVYLLDQDDFVLDAVMIAENLNSWSGSGKDYFAKTAEFLFDQGVWKSAMGTIGGVTDTVDSSKIGSATTKSISRSETGENSHTAEDWYITATSGVSPGLPNKP